MCTFLWKRVNVFSSLQNISKFRIKYFIKCSNNFISITITDKQSKHFSLLFTVYSYRKSHIAVKGLQYWGLCLVLTAYEQKVTFIVTAPRLPWDESCIFAISSEGKTFWRLILIRTPILQIDIAIWLLVKYKRLHFLKCLHWSLPSQDLFGKYEMSCNIDTGFLIAYVQYGGEVDRFNG